MVMSNKKLKQKLRAAKAELIVESEVQNKLTYKGSENSVFLDSKSPGSLRILLNTDAPKITMSKREKRRQKIPSFIQEQADVLKNREIGGIAEIKNEGGLKSAHEEVKKKKRKRDESKTVVDVLKNREISGAAEIKNEGDLKSDHEEVKKKKKSKRDESKTLVHADQSKAGRLKKKKKPKNKRTGKVENKPVAGDEDEQNKRGSIKEQLMAKTNAGVDRKDLDVSSKVYVGGIPYYSTEDDIRSYFEGCGTITNIDCMEFPDTGKFRGIAIITFKTEAASKRALALDGSDMGGLFLKIQPFKSAKSSNFSPSLLKGYNRIYIGNLSWDITENDVKELFSDCSITSIRFGEDKETKYFKGYAHVDFADSLSLNIALKFDQKIVSGRPVRISCAVPKNGNAISTPTEKESKTDSSKVVSANEEVEVNSNADPPVNTEVSAVISSKIRRRTCYECGERGHLSSSCPKKNAVDSTNPIAV